MMLFEPIRIGGYELKNRIVMAPMVTGFAEKDGSVSDKFLNYYVRRAQGGCGLIIVEAAVVDPDFAPTFAIRIDHDQYIPAMANLAKSIKDHGAGVILQLGHPGKQTSSRFFGRQTIAPSAIPHRVFKEEPHALTIEEIKQLVERYISASVRAREAGFDGVEIHAAHNYLISQFLSPYDNRRTDEYGGDLTGRAQFAVEIIQGIRKKMDDFIISIRFSAEQYEDGVHLGESKSLVPLLEAAGSDLIHVSAGSYNNVQWMIPPMTQPMGCMLPLASEVNRVARKPVIAVGRIGTPELAEEILERGYADLVALGRPLFADPDFPQKSQMGEGRQIRPCIACNTCFDQLFLAKPVRCLVNPELEYGASLDLKKSDRSKKVLIVGGGPAGLEAARSLVLRGHQVSLWEKESCSGGQLQLAMAVPGRKEFIRLIRYYESELARLGVDYHKGRKATIELIKEEAPDVLITATGVRPKRPEIPGMETSNVFTAHEILAGKKISGQRAVVIGGGYTGCETAKFLVEKGYSVAVLRRGPKIAREAGWSVRRLLLEELRELGVELIPDIEYKGIGPDGVQIIQNGEERQLPADIVVLATGVTPNEELFQELQGVIKEIYNIGDSKEPGDVADAIEGARRIALQI